MQGATIKNKLSQLGTTQAELAQLLDVSPQAVSGILSAFDVRTGTIERICDVLHLPISFFFDEADEDATNNLEKLKARKVAKIWRTNNIGDKVRLLLREQQKKLISLCEYVGMTDPGLRKVFDRDTCNITTLKKIAEFFAVPVTYFLPEDDRAKEETEKDRELEYLRGQVEAYKTIFAFLSKSKEALDPLFTLVR